MTKEEIDQEQLDLFEKQTANPVEFAGTYYCVHKDCIATQYNYDELGETQPLFYGDNNEMYCKEHIGLYVK